MFYVFPISALIKKKMKPNNSENIITKDFQLFFVCQIME